MSDIGNETLSAKVHQLVRGSSWRCFMMCFVHHSFWQMVIFHCISTYVLHVRQFLFILFISRNIARCAYLSYSCAGVSNSTV